MVNINILLLIFYLSLSICVCMMLGEATEEEVTAMRRHRCTDKYMGRPFNLIQDYGTWLTTYRELPPSLNETYRNIRVYYDVKTRIGVKNAQRHLLAGSHCDLIIVFYNSRTTFTEALVLFFILDDMAEGHLKNIVVKQRKQLNRDVLHLCLTALTCQGTDNVAGVFIVSCYDTCKNDE